MMLEAGLRRSVVGALYRKVIKKDFTRQSVAAYAAPFSSPGSNQIHYSRERLMGPMRPLPKGGSKLVGAPAGAHVSAGLTSITPDRSNRNTLFFCNIHGIFKSTDGGKTFRLVLRSEVE